MIVSTNYADLAEEYTDNWSYSFLQDSPVLTDICNKILDGSRKYQYIIAARPLNIPWQIIAAIHYRECGLDFSKCLHNGDPLPGPTTHVPIGRGPFSGWVDAATDAMRWNNFNSSVPWSVPRMLYKLEMFNGMGYRLKHGIYSPYLYSGTNFYTCGKYSSDGVFDPMLVDQQIGCIPLLKKLLSY